MKEDKIMKELELIKSQLKEIKGILEVRANVPIINTCSNVERFVQPVKLDTKNNPYEIKG